MFGILFSWRQLLHCLQFESSFCFVANKEGEIINILFQNLHYPLEQEYGLKKIRQGQKINVQVCMFWQELHLAKYAWKRIYKIKKNDDISIFAFPLDTVISFCHIVACNFLHLWTPTCQVSLCLCKNVVDCYWNQSKPSQLKNCLVLVDIENTMHRMPWKKKM